LLLWLAQNTPSDLVVHTQTFFFLLLLSLHLLSAPVSIAAFQSECIDSIAAQLAPIAELTVEQARTLVVPGSGDKSAKDSGDYQVAVARINKFKKLTANLGDTCKDWASKASVARSPRSRLALTSACAVSHHRPDRSGRSVPRPRCGLCAKDALL
jgi:hypothetical protein